MRSVAKMPCSPRPEDAKRSQDPMQPRCSPRTNVAQDMTLRSVAKMPSLPKCSARRAVAKELKMRSLDKMPYSPRPEDVKGSQDAM